MVYVIDVGKNAQLIWR